MLYWALIAFVVAVIAGALGFSGIASGAAMIAQLLFGLFLVLAIIFLLLGIGIFKAAT